MSALCVYSQTDSTLERRNYLDGDFVFDSYGSKIYKPNNNTSVNESNSSTILAFTYGFSVKKNAQHGIGIACSFNPGTNLLTNTKFLSIDAGLVYHYLYQRYLNKKLAIFGSWSPRIILNDVNNIKTNNSVRYSFKNNLCLGLSYDLDKHWTIRTTLLEYENVYSSRYGDNNLRGFNFYETSNSLSLRSFIYSLSLRYYY